MTVQILTNNGSFESFANITIWDMAKQIGWEIPRNNDPLEVSAEDAIELANKIREWVPHKDWSNGQRQDWLKEIIVDLFEHSGGFTTY